MNILFYILCSAVIHTSTTLYSAESPTYYFRPADVQDVNKILYIINNEAYKDHTKIVILPEIFRKSAIEKDIRSKRLFVATDSNNNIVAFKKLFIVRNHSEFNEITTQELRCLGDSRIFVDASLYDKEGNRGQNIPSNHLSSFSLEDSAVIYFGGDYTMISYRDQKINARLTQTAFNYLEQELKTSIETHILKNLVLLYGLTKLNAGEYNGIDRTPSIVRVFMKCSHAVAKNSCETVIHSRYQSFMPTFDRYNTECEPLPDSHAIAGYGNILVYPLIKQKDSNDKP